MNWNWQNVLFSLPGILLGLTLHEYCHAFAAYKLGDNTARDMGRLTFNPIKHIDPIGLLFIIFAGFGWAKPVQFFPGNLRNLRRDKAIIAAAGPLSNLVLALALIGIVKGWIALIDNAANSGNAEGLISILYSGPVVVIINTIFRAATINLGLFIFNLFPIPPLDGSHIVFSGLNLKAETELMIMKIGGPLLFIIIIIQNRTELTILPIGRLVSAMLRFFIPELG
jgi:Zn-dependent protease